MSCQRCGGVLAAELTEAMQKLICEMFEIEGWHCHCDEGESSLQTNLPREGRGAFAGESPATTTSKGDQNG
jgi:hypothetical protein